MSNATRKGWTPYKLDELGFVGRGKSRHRPRNSSELYAGPYPFIQTAEVTASEFYITEYSQTYSELGLSQSKMWDKNTLCIVIAGENTAETAILNFRACFPDSIIGFVADSERTDVRFIKYYLRTIKKQLRSVTKGATQDNLSVEKLLSFDILTPSLLVQKKIVGILSAYDELIENNTRRIKILEDMTQMLYREWFVHFRFPGHGQVKMVDSELGLIPEGWEIVKLGNIAAINAFNISNGNAPAEINYIDIASVSTGLINKVEFLAFRDAPSRARRLVQHGDIIWSTVRPNRKSYSLILNPIPNLVVSTGFAVITPKQAPYTYLYHALTTDDFADYLTNNATGSAYPAVNSGDFKNADVLLPSSKIVSKFHSLIVDLFNQKQNFNQKNESLRCTRDLLLPKLIAGEIDVESLDINTGEIAV